MEYLPHRYPFLLVDRVLAFERHVSITGLKNVTSNEAFFQGHFPGRPVTPGVLILEAIAQVGGLLLLEEKPDGGPSPIVYMTGVDKARWRRPVVPGDQLVIRATLLRARKTLFRLGALAEVDGETVASAEISCHVVMESSST
jgi:3-hydroxyacyl-[acyl-carrier-protein] dehydratase